MTLRSIKSWQKTARPDASEKDTSLALGIFLEEVAEVLAEFTQLSATNDGVTTLSRMLYDIAMFAHELKTSQLEVSVPVLQRTIDLLASFQPRDSDMTQFEYWDVLSRLEALLLNK